MRILLLCLLAAAPSLAGEKEILQKPRWSNTGGGPTVSWKKEKGALHIANTNADDRAPHNWFTRFDVPKGAPYRVKLKVRIKAKNLAAGAKANVMVQVYPKEGRAVGYAWCEEVDADTDWTDTHAVFEIPEGAAYVRILSYLVGKGEAWFEGHSVKKTTEELTAAPTVGGGGKYWKLARACAEEIEWTFDPAAALQRAKKEKKPVLVYARVTDDQENLESARTTLGADKVRALDDGLSKDILFRAGPLSDPDVADLINRRFVPLLLTYHFATIGTGRAPRGDPLPQFGFKAAETVVPALLVAKADGKPVRRLHRIGTISTDLVDHWLRAVLKEAGARSRATTPADLYKDGELARVARDPLLKAKAQLRLGELDKAAKHPAVKGYVHLRRGEWKEAHDALRGDGEAERFWRAWCLHRMGRHEEAEKQWRALAGPTRYGRKAAACVLPQGPRLWLSESTRLWPRSRKLPEETEGIDPDGFEAAQSMRVLLELQQADGSFGSHRGATGYGYWDGAMTAIAGDALLSWRNHLPALKERIDAAHARALAYLAKWAGRRGQNGDAFNDPYVLMHLVRAGSREAGAKVIEKMRASQKKDGNWTVYQEARPASFNTAQAVLALAEARDAGWTVPAETLARGVKALAAMRQRNDLFPYSTMKGHEWMTTEHGSIARDPLCEHALLRNGQGDRKKLERALVRWAEFGHELRRPTKKYYDYFNLRGHGGYYFFYAHRNALEAAAHAGPKTARRTRDLVRTFVLQAREGDGAFMDHYMNGRGYGTAQALILLAPPEK